MILKRALIATLVLLFSWTPKYTFAQAGNIFLQRSYWKAMPDIANVKNKIDLGNDATEANQYGFDGVTYAILENAPLQTIKYLISIKGNEPNKITHDGRNYIFWAAYRSNIPLMQFLLSKGSKVDIIDTHGNNPITFAASTGVVNIEVYDLLLTANADINHTDYHGANALLLIMPHLSSFEILNYFIAKGLDLKSVDNDGNNAFNYAARTGNIQIMELLISKGLDYKNLNKAGGNAMFFAAQGTRNKSNTVETYQYLERLGIKPNVTTHTGETPLHIVASRSKDIGVYAYFLSKGVDANQTDDEGNTPLTVAARNKNFFIVKLLAEKTKDINHFNKKEETALNIALTGNSEEVVEYLISKKAQLNKNSGKALIDGFKPNESNVFIAKAEALKAIDFKPTEAQADGNTLLHYAAAKDDINLYKIVTEWGVDINAKNDEGYTALHLAAMKASNTESLQYLISKGADIKTKTDFEESAYMLAQENEMLSQKNIDITFLKP